MSWASSAAVETRRRSDAKTSKLAQVWLCDFAPMLFSALQLWYIVLLLFFPPQGESCSICCSSVLCYILGCGRMGPRPCVAGRTRRGSGRAAPQKHHGRLHEIVRIHKSASEWCSFCRWHKCNYVKYIYNNRQIRRCWWVHRSLWGWVRRDISWWATSRGSCSKIPRQEEEPAEATHQLWWWRWRYIITEPVMYAKKCHPYVALILLVFQPRDRWKKNWGQFHRWK